MAALLVKRAMNGGLTANNTHGSANCKGGMPLSDMASCVLHALLAVAPLAGFCSTLWWRQQWRQHQQQCRTWLTITWMGIKWQHQHLQHLQYHFFLCLSLPVWAAVLPLPRAWLPGVLLSGHDWLPVALWQQLGTYNRRG